MFFRQVYDMQSRLPHRNRHKDRTLDLPESSSMRTASAAAIWDCKCSRHMKDGSATAGSS